MNTPHTERGPSAYLRSSPYLLVICASSVAVHQGLSQDLETGCQKLAIVKLMGVQIIKGDQNILSFQP